MVATTANSQITPTTKDNCKNNKISDTDDNSYKLKKIEIKCINRTSRNNNSSKERRSKKQPGHQPMLRIGLGDAPNLHKFSRFFYS